MCFDKSHRRLSPQRDRLYSNACQSNWEPNVQAYKTHTYIPGFLLEDIPFWNESITLLHDTSTSQPQPVVPTGGRHGGFAVIHSLSHISKFIWRGLNNKWEFGLKPAPLATTGFPCALLPCWPHRCWWVGSLPPFDGYSQPSPWLIISPDGHMQFLFSIQPPPLPVPKHWLQTRSLISGFLYIFPLTEAHSSPLETRPSN